MIQNIMDLICIDMDNTLIDSDKAHISAYNMALKKNHLNQVPDKKIKKFLGLVSREIIKRLYPKLSKQEIIKIVNDHDEFFLKKTKKYLKPFNRSKQTLKKLKEKYKLALISNCTHREIISSLRNSNIDKSLFDIVIGNDQVESPKPSPDEIMKAEKLLNVKAKFMIGDSIHDVKAGKKARVIVIALLTGNNSKKELKQTGADFILNEFKDVLKIL